jgi:hypothetical protein
VDSWWALAVAVPLVVFSFLIGIFELSKLLNGLHLPLGPFVKRSQPLLYVAAGPAIAVVYLALFVGSGASIGGEFSEAGRGGTITFQLIAATLAVVAIPRTAVALGLRREGPPPDSDDVAIISHGAPKEAARAYVRSFVVYVVARTLERAPEIVKEDREHRARKYLRHIPPTHILNVAYSVFDGLDMNPDDLPTPARQIAQRGAAIQRQTFATAAARLEHFGSYVLGIIEAPPDGVSRQRGSHLMRSAAKGIGCPYRRFGRSVKVPNVDALKTL